MGLLDDVQADDAIFAFGDTDVFAESLTYTKVGGATRSIVGVVDRDPPERMDVEGQVYKPKMTIDVPHNTTNGIVTTEINSGGDTITVAYERGGSAVAHPIRSKNPITQDAGMIRLEVG